MEELIGTKFSFNIISEDGNDSLHFGTPCYSATKKHPEWALLVCYSSYSEGNNHKAGIYLDNTSRRALAGALLKGLPT